MKFNNADNSFYTTLKQRVEEHLQENGESRYGGSRIIIKALIMIALYVTPIVLIITLDLPWWAYLVFAILIGIAKAGVGFVVMHDSIHGTFSSNKKVNKIFSYATYFVGAAIFPWKVKHNIMHHTYTNIHGMDGDIESKALLRLSFKAPLWKVHKFQYIYAFFFYMFTSLAFLIGDYVDLFTYRKKGMMKQFGSNFAKEFWTITLFRIIYLGIFIALPILYVGLPWWGTLIGFFVIHFVAGFILSAVFQMAHLVEETKQPEASAEGELELSWAAHQLETTANFAPKNKLLGWYVGGLNYQVEHHLLPNISHVHYKQVSKIVRDTAKEFNLPYHEIKTFGGAIKSHIKTLKNLGRIAPAV